MGHPTSVCLPCLAELSLKFASFSSLWLFRSRLFRNSEEFKASYLLLFLGALFKVCRPGPIEKHVAASGYPMPEVLFVLKNPCNKMVIDMRPGGSTGLTTCSINTFCRCVTKGLDLAEQVTLCPTINLDRKQNLRLSINAVLPHHTTHHAFELVRLGVGSCNPTNQATDSHHRAKTAHGLIQGVLSVPEKPSLTR